MEQNSTNLDRLFRFYSTIVVVTVLILGHVVTPAAAELRLFLVHLGRPPKIPIGPLRTCN